MPNNLLLEIFKYGGLFALGCKNDKKNSAERIEAELDDLAKRFGYSGLSEFDRKL